MASTISVQNVSKRFGKREILKQVNLAIPKGEIYGLIGPSGAGKTTLVKLIVGMEKLDEGTIEVLQTPMPNLSVLNKIGYMAQSDALYTELTGWENLKFFASLYKMTKHEQKQRLDYVADLVNLTSSLGSKVGTYSGGMKRRLSLAIALVHNPDVLILDEPTVGMDPALRVSIWKELLRLKEEEDKTIIVTTHVMDEAEKCDTVAMVRDGHVLTTGSPSELKEEYQVDRLDDVFLRAGGSEA
ncbi:MAG TPA: ABC transporter ATP-binding protein [Sporolactobacillaceae bacterium]|nr:ABC transporter ATP-binding protein [Sporolactobacillaceae bacterium]